MNTAQRWLLAVAIVLNVFAAGWWASVAIDVTSRLGWHALASSGALMWLLFALPPIAAIAALASVYRLKKPA
jgi:hypothetical protein